jgi:hypothetical protein
MTRRRRTEDCPPYQRGGSLWERASGRCRIAGTDLRPIQKSRQRRKYISAENLGDWSQRVEDNAFHLCADEPPLPGWGKDQGEGNIFRLTKSRFGALVGRWIGLLESKPNTAVF